MGMDRNTVIGFILIGVLLVGMFYFNSRSNQAYLAEQKRIEDSIAATKPKINVTAARLDSLKADSLRKLNQQGIATAFKTPDSVKEVLTILENEVLKIGFSNKGGQPKTVELKKFKRYDGKPLVLENGGFNKLSYPINVVANQIAYTGDLLFVPGTRTINADKGESISFTLKDSSGREIIHQYSLHPGDYMIDLNISLDGADRLVSQNTLNLNWQTEAPQVEKVISYEKQQAQLGYVKEGDYDYKSMASSNDKKFDKPLDWLSVKQQFFLSAIIAKNKFSGADVAWTVPDDSMHIVAQATANCRISLPAGAVKAQVPLQLYYGPSDYNVLKKYGNQMQNIVPYGEGIFAFVKYINRHFLLPIWDFLRKNVASYGMVILLLTLLIRLITSPILYKSYLSGAKMKALKPELDALREKCGDDKQAFSMEQMKLWKTAGVSPLGGCLPALLQIPIFMSLYYFFQSNISLRNESFLWAKNLASYDSILDFGHVPLLDTLYGSHISLFTLLAVLTSLIISVYSMSSMQDNSNPVMKYMPYIFPVLLLGVFNRLPAALTWYYTVSNTITLILQIVIQKYVINHDKIRLQIEENKKKPVKQSKLQERMQAMQESQKKLQDLKNKNSKR
ncbi:MAG: membrane protein insertase YidC [Chitinophagaceae bacterium]|nr:membrane protein insertase YidC [Chitinophagaceae bacterium]